MFFKNIFMVKIYRICILLCSVIALALPKTVSFKIEGTGDLSGYSLIINKADFFFETDAQGRAYNPLAGKSYTVELENGIYQIEIIRGSEKQLETIEITDNSPEEIILAARKVKTEKASKKLDEVLIRGTTAKESLARTVITVDEAKLIPGTGGDPLRSIINFPGVVGANAFSSVLFIRGGDPEDVLYTYDYIPIYNPFHSLGFYSAFSDYLLDSINFYPASYPVRFNNSQGAVIQIEPRIAYDKKMPHFDLDANLAIAKANITVPMGNKMQLTIGGKRSYYEAYIKLVSRFTNIPFNIVPYYYDANVKYDYKINDHHSIYILGVLYRDVLKFNFEDFPLTNSRGQTNYFSGNLDLDNYFDLEGLQYRFNKGKVDNRFFFYRYFEKLKFSIAQMDETFKKEKYSVINHLRIDAAPIYTIGLGGTFLYEKEPFTTTVYEDSSFQTNRSISQNERYAAYLTNKTVKIDDLLVRYSGNIYLDNELKLGKFTLQAGTSAAYNNISRQFSIEPRGCLSFELGESRDVYMRLGRYGQNKELYPYMSEDLGNPDLYNQKSMHYVIGSELLIFRDYLIKTETYYKRMTDQVLRNPYWQYDMLKEARQTPRYNNYGEGEAWGFEAMLRRRISRGIFGWLSYSYSHSLRLRYNQLAGTDKISEDERHSRRDMTWYIHNHDVPHSLIKNYLKAGAKYSLQSGKPYTPYASVVETVDKKTGTTNKSLVRSENINSRRMPVNQQLSARIDATIPIRKVDLTFYLDCWNIQYLWYKNTLTYYYELEKMNPGDDPEEKKRAVRDLPLMPFLGIEIRF